MPAALLVWLPILPSETHLLRNALQSILTSYFIISCIGLLLRTNASTKQQVVWAVALGTAFSLCYLNREEAAWLSAVLVASIVLFGVLLRAGRSFSWQRAGWVAGLVAVSAAPLILVVCLLNYRSYGVFLTTFRRSDAFISAYQAMTSLEPEFQNRIFRSAMTRGFAPTSFSPTFAKLKPILEDGGSYWVAGNDGHSKFNGYDPADKEFFVSNFEFALQFAAFHAGAKTAAEAEQLFAAISREITEAIRAGKIKAGRHGPATLAALHDGDLMKMIGRSWVSFSSLATLKRAELDWSAVSVGDPAELEKVSLFVHSSLTRRKAATEFIFGLRGGSSPASTVS